MKTYVTFGQDHRHEIGGTVFDKDTVAVIEGPDAIANRNRAFDLFGTKFCFEYPEEYWDERKLSYFPKGLVPVPNMVQFDGASARQLSEDYHAAKGRGDDTFESGGLHYVTGYAKYLLELLEHRGLL